MTELWSRRRAIYHDFNEQQQAIAALYASAIAPSDNGAMVNAKHLLWGAVLIGTAAGYVWSAAPRPAAPATAQIILVSPPSPEAIEHSVYYPNCAAARAEGHAPIFRGQPGYRSALDADNDGIACEPYRGM